MINIVIPMAGAGQRFIDSGYRKPKPFIQVNDKPMIMHVLDNLSYPNAHYILIARREHLENESGLIDKINSKYDAEFITIDHLSEGTACTVLHARSLINNDTPLLIANSDQIVDIDIKNFIDNAISRKLDGSIMTFKLSNGDNKWSYARIDSDDYIVEVKEKVAISEYATVGIYYYAMGRFYVDSALDMIISSDRVNGEYYTCPTYNYMIRDNKKIGKYDIDYNQMHGLGTPDDLDKYIKFKSRGVSK